MQHMPWGDIVNKIVAATAGRPALVDSTGLGDPILDQLQRTSGVHFEGYTFSSASNASPEGYHDDCVCALALAVMCRTTVPAGIEVTPDLMRRIAMMPRRRRH
jgi:hypothetical protein